MSRRRPYPGPGLPDSAVNSDYNGLSRGRESFGSVGSLPGRCGPSTSRHGSGVFRMEASEEPGSIFRERRAAQNQSLFREVNERIEPLHQRFNSITASRLNDFICECANEGCSEMVALSVEEYESIRETPKRFFVAPSEEHVWLDVERIVEQRDRYWVVEKLGVAGKMATGLDPRARETA
jgi:hypothetical protein